LATLNSTGAKNFLAQVYLVEGEDIFAEEYPKYMNFLKTIIDWIKFL